MLGYEREELKGLHLENLYENTRMYDEIVRRIQQDLKAEGKSTISTWFGHKNGFSIDAEIHIAPLAAKIIYYNDAAINAMVRYGTRGSLEEFFPQDRPEILPHMD